MCLKKDNHGKRISGEADFAAPNKIRFKVYFDVRRLIVLKIILSTNE